MKKKMKKSRWRRIFSEKTIMHLVMVVLLDVILVVVTIAWYTMAVSPELRGLALKTDGMHTLDVDVQIRPYLADLDQETVVYSEIYTNAQLKQSAYAALAPDGVHYNITRMALSMVKDMAGAAIDLGQEEMNSLEADKLAPGAYGKVKLYIRSRSDSVNAYCIQIEPKPVYASDSYAADRKAELKALAEDHIRFFQNCKVSPANRNDRTYSGRIHYGQENGLKGALTAGTEAQVMLYWCWPYEYTDIPVEAVTTPSEISATSHDIESYDDGDTKLGNYVTDIGFSFTVIGEGE